ncbi:MAG: hypothetical protein KDD47_10060 [Acidobacteria bacterium]|nr:hypothetical protein [Acidobacteriota bacterium]
MSAVKEKGGLLEEVVLGISGNAPAGKEKTGAAEVFGGEVWVVSGRHETFINQMTYECQEAQAERMPAPLGAGWPEASGRRAAVSLRGEAPAEALAVGKATLGHAFVSVNSILKLASSLPPRSKATTVRVASTRDSWK